MMNTTLVVIMRGDELLLVQQSISSKLHGIWTLPYSETENKKLLTTRIVAEGLKEDIGLDCVKFNKLFKTHSSKRNTTFLLCSEWTGYLKSMNSNITDIDWFTYNKIYLLNKNLISLVNNNILYLFYLIQHYNSHPEIIKECDTNE